MRCRGPECEREVVYVSLQLCKTHYGQHRKGQELRSLRAPYGSGTNQDGYIRRQRNGRRVFEHRYVMEQALGRQLLPDETVHHKNGDRTDNRLANLELWSSRHARGQRVEDLVDYAVEILRTYAPERLA